LALLFVACLPSLGLRQAAEEDEFKQVRPAGPIIDFATPIYNVEGYRTYYIKGEQGIYHSRNLIRIIGLEIRQYSGDETDTIVSTAKSPEAIFQRDSNTASGPSSLPIENEAFTVYGEDWTWRTKDNQITFNDNVKVVIFDQIGDILR